MIPFSDPSASYQSHKDEIDQAIRRVLDSGWYVLGREVESFEQEFATFHGHDFHSVGVANGTDAIALSLRALGLKEGDEVVTASHTAVATVAGIEQAGCRPVFADIDPITRCLCSQSLQSRISDRTRAIIPVHIFGQPCDMISIMEIARSNDLLVVEDCSQAHAAEIEGKKVGTFGDLATFSCYPTKNLGALGDGGVVLCPDREKAERLRQLRQYGWDNERESIHSGVNSRLDELQAAILRVKLKHLHSDNEKRRRWADLYDDLLLELPLIRPHRNLKELHAMHLYVIECDERDGLLSHLRERGIGASLHYHLPVHRHQAYSGKIRGADDLPNTEAFYQRNLTLPLFPELEKESVEKIANEVRAWFDRT
jgi:dTDP-4-amino-4,6-dideoxygalactose transaminase